jgi:uncharacterized UPF0160 family protein
LKKLKMLSFLSRKIKVVVHNGKFHPDDVAAVAILSIYLNKPIKIFRSRDPKVWAEADYVFDVGGEFKPEENKFDHHQEGGAGVRPNGIKYSSAGLVWKHFGEKVAGSPEIWKKIEEKIIQPIDADDNGIELVKNIFEDISPYSFTDYIYSFNPTAVENNEGSLKAFEAAVEVTKKMLAREIKIAKDRMAHTDIVRNIYEKTEDKQLIILDEYYYWKNVLEEYKEPLLVIFPHRQNDTWTIYTISMNEGSEFERRLLLPKSWAGKRDKELVEITGVPDAVFCHNGRFIAGAKSKEGAIALAKLALNQNKL